MDGTAKYGYEEAKRAAEAITEKTGMRPETAVILGSGLGVLADGLEDAVFLPYGSIPGFPVSSIEGHAGQLAVGRTGGKTVAAMQGRFHYYEGFSMKQIAFPVYVLRLLGVRTLIVTNACGGIHPQFVPGDLMLITDHINLTGVNPLIGPNDERLGTRFPDMSDVYSSRLRAFVRKAADELAIPLREGVYAFFPGPCYETAAEIRALRAMGADAVGMSTVPEATAAKHAGMEVIGLSCITNLATGLAKTAHSHAEVLAAAQSAGTRFRILLERILAALQD